jgi:hypothetical protein
VKRDPSLLTGPASSLFPPHKSAADGDAIAGDVVARLLLKAKDDHGVAAAAEFLFAVGMAAATNPSIAHPTYKQVRRPCVHVHIDS